MEYITIELIGGTIITLLAITSGWYLKQIFFVRDIYNNIHLYSIEDIKRISKNE
jgi:hypothetical protein